jgi:hypothetical protein
MDIVFVIAIAVVLFLTTTWFQGRQEAPVVEQVLNSVQQHWQFTREGYGSLFDKSRTQYSAGKPD